MHTYKDTIAHFATLHANAYADYMMSYEDNEDNQLSWVSFNFDIVKTISFIYTVDAHEVYQNLKQYTYDHFGDLCNEKFETWYDNYKKSKNWFNRDKRIKKDDWE